MGGLERERERERNTSHEYVSQSDKDAGIKGISSPD